MKGIKRIGAILLSLAMIVTMLPVFSLSASAATALTTTVEGLVASWEYNDSNIGGSATWTSSTNTITCSATGATLRTNTSVLTMTNNLGSEATLKFNWSQTGGSTLNYGSISGAISSTSNSSGTYEGVLADGASITISVTSPRSSKTTVLSITGISLVSTSAADPNVLFRVPENGSYTIDGTAVTEETSMTVTAGTEIVLAATAATGYNFYGWWNESTSQYLSQSTPYTFVAAADAVLKPVFLSDSVALFGVGTAKYDDLNDACAAAAAGSIKTVVLLNNGTISGTHTIPSGVTLLVPYNDANSVHGSSPSCTSYTDILGGKGNVAWVSPTAYRTLTMAADAHITVNGTIEVGGQHASGSGATGMYAGSPTGPLGYINMLAGSHIDLNSGAYLYSWGYIYGDGTITAKSGAAIYENFQIQDFRGGDKSTELAESLMVFPVSQYYVQNIEVATKYEYGSTEYVHTSVYMSRTEQGATVQFIGDNAMFRPQAGSYVIKDYDPTTDNLYLETYGDCALSELQMTLAGVAVNSANFVLPITNNIQIRIKSGTASLQQNVMMLPGSSITIDEGATLDITATDTTTDVVTAGGYILQLFDSVNWTQGVDQETFEVVTGRYYIHPAGLFRAVPYTCTTRKTRTNADLKDVTMDINGTVIANGFLYSTVTYADILNEDYTITGGGANIISSNGTGSIEMVSGPGQDVFGVMYDQSASTDGTFYYIPLASAQLTNGNGSMLDTTYAEAGTTYAYCNQHGCWYTGECEQCSDPCADGHNYVGEQTTAPTCTEAGVTTYTCSACGDSYTEAIAALGHTAGAAADCENAQTCTVCGTELAPALGHSYNGVVTAPDCVNGGYTTYTCANCGDSYVDNHTDALGHNYVSEQTTAPTCGAEGVTTYTCSACGDSYTEAIAATGKHSYDHAYDADCNVCGAVHEVEQIFTFGGNSVTEQDAICQCGLGFLFNVDITGTTVDEKHVADYTDATIGGYEVIKMGAIVTNGTNTIDIEAKKLWDENANSFAVRIKNIPDGTDGTTNHLTTDITATPYVILLINGVQYTVYGDSATANYQEVLDRANEIVE